MKKKLTEKEIDDLVIVQAEREEAWEAPIFVNRKEAYTLVAEVIRENRQPIKTSRPTNGKSGGKRLKVS